MQNETTVQEPLNGVTINSEILSEAGGMLENLPLNNRGEIKLSGLNEEFIYEILTRHTQIGQMGSMLFAQIVGSLIPKLAEIKGTVIGKIEPQNNGLFLLEISVPSFLSVKLLINPNE